MMISHIPSRRSRSPEDSELGERKRRRTPYSCFECRRRKLKCDRAYPICGRCQKSASSCNYDPEAIRAASAKETPDRAHVNSAQSSGVECPQAPPRSPKEQVERPSGKDEGTFVRHPARRIALLERKIATLEATLHRTNVVQEIERASSPRPICFNDNLNLKDVDIGRVEQTSSETMIFRGKEFQTQFFGASSAASCMCHFSELRFFMKQTLTKNSALGPAQNDLNALDIKRKRQAAQNQALVSSAEDLRSLIPDKSTADHYVALYFETYETVYHILHAPTFWSKYQNLWDNARNAEPSFIAILLLVISAVFCLSSKNTTTKFIGHSSVSREKACKWINACDAWIERQSQKHAELAHYQVHFLLVLAKQTNVVKKKQSWRRAGDLLRFAISAGLHRDPAMIRGQVSPFNRELRRRLWAAYVEFELEAALDRGMPAYTAGISTDCAAPLNIEDEQLCANINVDSLKPEPDKVTTLSSFLYLSRRSLALRLRLTSVINEPGHRLAYEQVMKYDDQITEATNALSKISSVGAGQMTLSQAILDLQLRQYRLMLHVPFARQTTASSRNSLSKFTCIQAAREILEIYSSVNPLARSALSHLRFDVLRASLCICHNLTIPTTDSIFTTLGTSFLHSVESALRVLEDKLMRLGEGLKEYWFVLAAYHLAQSHVFGTSQEQLKQRAIERVLSVLYRFLASQTPLPDLMEPQAAGVTPSIQDYQKGNASLAASIVPTLESGFQPQDTAFQTFDFPDLSEWTLENFWTFELDGTLT